MLKKLAIGLVAVIVIICGLAATKPDTFSVKREITIKATPDKIAPLIADFHQWTIWSPWEKLDPNMQRTFSGPASGVGAGYTWKGNKDVGSGGMDITAQDPAHIDIKLMFHEPFESVNKTVFAFTPKGDSTTVTWTMNGPMNFFSKIMCIFMDMDAMIGKDFEKGLSQMKAAAEK